MKTFALFGTITMFYGKNNSFSFANLPVMKRSILGLHAKTCIRAEVEGPTINDRHYLVLVLVWRAVQGRGMSVSGLAVFLQCL